MAIKVGFVSLGCPKNTCDTEVMLKKLIDAGFDIVPEDHMADVMIVNTCAFIESAKQESIDYILDLAYLKEHHSLKGIVVTGCLATRYAEDIEKSLPEADGIVAAGAEGDIVEAVKAVSEGKRYKNIKPTECLALGGERVVTTPEYTAYLKIAEGCDNRCTYCAIPDIRGPFRSRELDSILAEARELSEMGVRELCLVAQDTTRWGEDIYGEYSLDKLVETLATDEKCSFEWIRLLYCYPDKITDRLVDVIAKYDNVAKYIDMPIQHINEDVLRRMNRRGGRDAIVSAIKRLRDAVPGITIRTTVIAGFPGETAAEFEELLSFVKESKFTRLGAFAYSREENTPAYSLPKQISKKIKETRVERLMEAQYNVHSENNEALIGKTLKILCEGYDKVAEIYYGRSEADAPEIDTKIYFSARHRVKDGEFVTVEITEVSDYDLIGREIG